MPDRRFEGALTLPDAPDAVGDGSIEPLPPEPARPAVLELAAAILIVGGMTSILSSVATIARLGDGTGPLDLALLGLPAATIVVGLLIRVGRAWVLAINVVAIVLFVELSALPAVSALVFAALDTIVLWALIRHRAWFARRSVAR
jgi:hypothetical protein